MKDPMTSAQKSITPSCWFLTGSQGLYGPETVCQVVDQSRQIVEQISRSTGSSWRPTPTPAAWV